MGTPRFQHLPAYVATIVLVGLTGFLAALAPRPAIAAGDAPPDVIYVGNVITMDPARPRAGAVATLGEAIVAVGDATALLAQRGPMTKIIQLGDRSLVPGFVDAHGHLASVARVASLANLSPPPSGTVGSLSELQDALRRHIRDRGIPPGEWVLGYGYDDAQLLERRHPNRDDLDAVSRDHPIYLMHASGHLSAANSYLLAARGINAATADPPGGVIRRRAGSREPDGVFEESASVDLYLAVPQRSPQQALDSLVAALQTSARYGITTVQEGGALPADLDLLEYARSLGLLNLDVVAYRYWSGFGEAPVAGVSASYNSRFRIGGIKLVLDGAPQGKTAFLSQPYLVPPPGRDAAYRGYPALPQPVVRRATREVLRHGVALLAHANGDAAAEMLIDAVAEARTAIPASRAAVTMIHAQTVRDDQLDRLNALGITPSFFVAHTFYWGDWHRDETLGTMRAERISPTRSARDRNIPFTLHNDAPIVPADIVRTLWSATTRRTRSNDILGPMQRLSVAEALAAVTIDAARQYGEERSKGSIEKGKQADLVILSGDPLAVAPDRLLELRVDETISRGKTVYRR